MKYRIITHGGCTDGFCSAFMIKKFFNIFFNTKLTQQDIENIEVIGLQPRDIQLGEFEFQSNDIVLDLPKPEKEIFFWCDHHLTAKPKDEDLNEKCKWKLAPSCTGYLIELAQDKGLKLTKELEDFQKSIDIMDNAEYTEKDIQQCYYPQKSYNTPLQKLHLIGSMFHTRDRNLNDEIFNTLLTNKLGDTPISTELINQLQPLMFHNAQLKGFSDWRDNVDTYLEYNERVGCVIQDDRKAKFKRGVVDRFYIYMKFPQASYGVNLKVIDESMARVGIGSNIFHKERCKVDISKLCKVIGKKFGEGSGGGHYHVGGCTINPNNCDEVIKFILEVFKRGSIE